MSFIGNVPAEAYSPVAKDTFSGDDSTTDFTLSIPATTNGVEVLVENVQQEPTTAYTISGTTLSFTAAPTTGTNNIYVIHRGPAVQTVVPPGDSITTAMIQDGAVTADKIDSLDKIEEGNSSVEVVDTGTGHVAVTVDGSETARFDAGGDFNFNSGYGSVATAYGCRAWVNFNGFTVSIRGSGNVSSVSDSGTGKYSVSFSTAMPDANYQVSCAGYLDAANTRILGVAGVRGTFNNPSNGYATGSIDIGCAIGDSGSGNAEMHDTDTVNVAIFR